MTANFYVENKILKLLPQRRDVPSDEQIDENASMGKKNKNWGKYLTLSVPYHTSCAGLKCKMCTAYIALFEHILSEVTAYHPQSIVRLFLINEFSE